MKKNLRAVILVAMIFVLAACQSESYEGIPKQQHFIASVNILQPSIDFFDEQGKKLRSWELKEHYTGAVLVGEEQILLYGNQLTEAKLYSLTTGKLLSKIEVEKGITNGYYDDSTKQFYLTNGDFNTVTSYAANGDKKKSTTTGLYPMAMKVVDESLYVINFKDQYMSVLNQNTLQLQKKIAIPKSSHGIDLVNGELWIGGHGAGEKPNAKVLVLNAQTGKKVGDINLPLMPIAFVSTKKAEYVLSHGESILYEVNKNKKIIWQKEVGSNPFAVSIVNETIVVAGYDDQTLYWIKDKKIIHTTKTGKGPFQLLVREE